MVVIGYVLASLLMRARTWMRVVVGGVVVVSWMMPAVTAGMTWYASTIQGGALGTLTGLHNTNFLDNWPLVVVTIANVWSMTGFSMLVMGAALRNIPSDAIEAAMVENASSWQRFRKIVLPLMRPTIIAVVLLTALLSLANFGLIYIMTQGGPGNSTNILPLYSYQQAFTYNNLAYGALIGNVMVLIATDLRRALCARGGAEAHERPGPHPAAGCADRSARCRRRTPPTRSSVVRATATHLALGWLRDPLSGPDALALVGLDRQQRQLGARVAPLLA